MRDMHFFDANCQVGQPMNGGMDASIASLLAEMDRNGVDQALLRHINLNPDGAVVTNEELAQMLAEEDPSGRLQGVWCILPEQCAELPPPDELFVAMAQRRIGALTLSPAAHRWVPSRLCIGKVMDAAAERRVPVLLPSYASDWAGLYQFMAEFPRITCIVTSTGRWGADRALRPLLEHYGGLHVELSMYWVPEGIKDLAELYGPERLLYGSGFPELNHGSTMLSIRHANIADSWSRQIAGGNLARLLEGAQLA
jgi:hypothetical protein